MSRWTYRGPVVSFFLFLSACDRQSESGEVPPEVHRAQPGICDQVGSGPVAGLPGRVGQLCVDPSSDVRRYGVAASSPLDAVCVELFNGECELYKSYGLEGVRTLRYVTDDERAVTVNVVASSFRRSEGAFGFFTRRVLGDGLPSQVTVKPLEVEGRAVSGVGMTVVWRGKEVVELTYVSETETPNEIEARSPGVLHPLSQAIARGMVGATLPERGALFLESLGVDQLGIAMLSDGLLRVNGTGPGVLGYFSDVKFPHRVVIVERRDEEGARDLLRLLRRSGASKKLKGRDIIQLRRTQEGAPPETWYLRRNDEVLLAVGPLDLAGAGPSQSTPDQRKSLHAAWEDFAVRRLMEVSTSELKFAGSKE